ncbi:MAG: histidine phosphatase family protein [Pseudomonadota bacterium]
MHLYLIRHPQPEVAHDSCYGQSDVAANQAHCEQVLPALSARLPAGIPIISSPLQRCSVLAQRLAAATHSATPVLDARLMEMNFGAWELRRWDDIPRAEVDAWAQDTLHYRPGGGENVLAMAARVLAFLHDMAGSRQGEAALVCHAGPIRLIQAYRPGMAAAALAAQAALSRHDIPFGGCISWDFPATI